MKVVMIRRGQEYEAYQWVGGGLVRLEDATEAELNGLISQCLAEDQSKRELERLWLMPTQHFPI